MEKKEIEEFVKDKHWYYYYNFDGVEVNKKKRKDKTLGFNNWDKVKFVMQDVFDIVDSPYVLDIGCNMGIYAHEMTKMGAAVTAIDYKTDNVMFYKKFLEENKKEKWTANIINIDVTKDLVKSCSANIITMFCVVYHIRPKQDFIFENLKKNVPSHRFVVLQGNIPRIKKFGQKEAGIPGMKKLLKNYGYSIYKVYEWNGYQKPIVIGERNVDELYK